MMIEGILLCSLDSRILPEPLVRHLENQPDMPSRKINSFPRIRSTSSRQNPRRITNPVSLIRLKSRSQRRIMSSDADYEAFLNKVNQDTAPAKPSSKSTFTTKAVDTEVPAALKTVQVDYVSEVDEPFEPVSLKWSKKTPPTDGTRSSLSRR
jgi:hypothetical protein